MTYFNDLDIKDYYDSSNCSDIGKYFIRAVLDNSVMYKRAVGFFSSTSLITTARGLLKVAKHYKEGEPAVIRFIVSPNLSKEDIEAINEGYRSKEKVIEEAMLREFKEPEDKFSKEYLNIICHLISSGAMDIKVAVSEFDNKVGLFHIKTGIFQDAIGEKVAFNGSLNETIAAFQYNFEDVTVFKSWTATDYMCRNLEIKFDRMWENQSKNVVVYNFPDAVNRKLFTYRKNFINENIEEEERYYLSEKNADVPKILIDLRQYQKDAIQSWFGKGGVGIFDMATGTGKTYTALSAVVKLLERAKYRLAVVIVAPYQHLVDQWEEDCKEFNIKYPIIGYSGAKHSDYYSRLRTSVIDYNEGQIENFFFICTYATFKSQKVQHELSCIRKNALIVADEVHNAGSSQMKGKLPLNFKYRLGLSATVDRYRDDEGTDNIYQYFGEKCIEYPLEKAIQENMLSQYEYHPIVTYLNEEEREKYLELSRKIAKSIIVGDDDEVELTEHAEQLIIKRARLIAGAKGKVTALRETLKDHCDEYHILVYCGTSKITGESGEEIRQIDEVTKMMGNELGMRVRKYTSQENVKERAEIKQRFVTGDDLQAIVAIKCLDEGVNIPAIKSAYILASSTNPREYIQRRGRVLRRFRGKDKAIIYDFICLPLPAEDLSVLDGDVLKSFKSLANNEINRITEFSKSALNAREGLALAEEIKKAFNMYTFEVDKLEQIEWREGENDSE